MCVGVQGHNDGKGEEDVGERLFSSETPPPTFSVFLKDVIGHGDAFLYLFYKNRFESGLPLYLFRDTITDKGKDDYKRALKKRHNSNGQ